ncbi:MAG TPA: hypothetical protein VKS60_12985 [Stellaceae bacterium]|nr:hypothetical protein [Stellaceae bacterium]
MDTPDPPCEPQGPSRGTKAWRARRDAVQRAAESDQERAAEDRAERDREAERDYDNPMGVWIGLGVIVLLLLGSLFIIDEMGCNALFSDRGLSRSGDCK